MKRSKKVFKEGTHGLSKDFKKAFKSKRLKDGTYELAGYRIVRQRVPGIHEPIELIVYEIPGGITRCTLGEVFRYIEKSYIFLRKTVESIEEHEKNEK